MSVDLIKSCNVCSQSYLESEYPGYCSKRCSEMIKDVASANLAIAELENTPDKRVFFYDIGIGEACDKYCVMLLRFHHQKKLAEKNETHKELCKLWDCIRSKINKSCYHPDTKLAVGELIVKLFASDARMWRLRSNVLNPNSSDYATCAQLYFAESIIRDDLRNQIDLLVEGRPRTIRVY